MVLNDFKLAEISKGPDGQNSEGLIHIASKDLKMSRELNLKACKSPVSFLAYIMLG